MAPFGNAEGAEWEGGYLPLPASHREADALDGVILSQREATKRNFVRYTDEASIIHLATHAIVNDEDPLRSYIVFYPHNEADSSYKLFAHELYNISLDKTHLAFLSACETASGKLVAGEGIMSLSRAFSYAGCPNLVTSLWKAEDHSTAYISERFYHYLHDGRDFAAALRQAKLDLLRDKQYAQFHDPSYWSHLVFVGTPLPSNELGEATWLWLLPWAEAAY